MIRGVRTPSKSRLHPIALIENEDGIQASIMEIINALVRNTIDFRRARPILRALHIAVKNSPRVHFDIYKSDMIHEVPNYPAAPASQKPASAALAQALARSRASRAPSQSASRGHGHPSSPPNPSPLVPSPPRASSPRPRPATSRATAQDEKMRLHSSK